MRLKFVIASILISGCASIPPPSNEMPQLQEGDETSAAVGRANLFKHLLQLAYRMVEGVFVISGLQEVRKEAQK